MSTDLLDQLIQQRRDRHEQTRQAIVQKAQQWLDQYGSEYGIRQAFIFGSANRPGHFHDASDVDIAVEQIDPAQYFSAIGVLSAWLERDVDLIELEKCPFQHRIRETGLIWTARPN
jgi:uncharacterized protein